MRLNLNDNIKVKLTEHGKDIYYHQYDRTNAFLGRELCKPSYPKVDEDGYTTFQLWCFIELYGIHMGMTLPNVIEPLDIVFDEPTIELRCEECEAFDKTRLLIPQPERKKGHWIRHPEQRNIFNGKTIECSECHEKYTVQYVEDELFCRHCGADMREPEDIPMEYFESGGR